MKIDHWSLLTWQSSVSGYKHTLGIQCHTTKGGSSDVKDATSDRANWACQKLSGCSTVRETKKIHLEVLDRGLSRIKYLSRAPQGEEENPAWTNNICIILKLVPRASINQ